MIDQGLLQRLYVASVCCVITSCTQEYAAPEWHEATLTGDSKGHAGRLSWVHVGSAASNGVNLWTGWVETNGRISEDSFQSRTEEAFIELSIAKFKDHESAHRYYDMRRQINDVPICKAGTADGFEYSLTQSLRPRSDPEGGGFYHDRRITYLDVWKNVTVVKIQVDSKRAGQKVNMDEVAQAVNKVVSRW